MAVALHLALLVSPLALVTLLVLVLVGLLAVRLFLALLSTEDMLPAGPLAFPKREERWRLEWPAEGARSECHC